VTDTSLILTEYLSLYRDWSKHYYDYLSNPSKESLQHYLQITNQLYTWLADRQRYDLIKESVSEELQTLARLMESYQMAHVELARLIRLEGRLLELYLQIQKNRPTLKRQLEGEENTYIRKKRWKESKELGAEIASLLVGLKEVRNHTVQKHGYDNYYSWSLAYYGLSEAEIDRYLQLLQEVTDPHYSERKGDVDKELGKKFDLRPEGIRLWHLEDPLAMEAPFTYIERSSYPVFDQKLISDVLPKTKERYGLTNTAELIIRPFPFEQRISGEEELQLLGEPLSGSTGVSRYLYDLGRGFASKRLQSKTLIDKMRDLPVHHAMGICLEPLVYQKEWLQEVAGVSAEELENLADEALLKQAQLDHLMKLRYFLTVAKFERDFYRLEKRNWGEHWWQLVEETQWVPRPETYDHGEWAASTWIGLLQPNSSLLYLCGVGLAMQLREQVDQGTLFAPLTAGTVEKIASELANRLTFSIEEEKLRNVLLKHWPKPEPKPAARPRRPVTPKKQ
jgi:peptidyl-dipeptidase A